jgi:hypothetical protein
MEQNAPKDVTPDRPSCREFDRFLTGSHIIVLSTIDSELDFETAGTGKGFRHL